MSCTMIEAEMYGMIVSAKMVMRPSAPPENMSNMSRMPPELVLKICARMLGSMPGMRDIGPEPVDHQCAQRKPDPLLELGRLGKGAEIETGGELFGG